MLKHGGNLNAAARQYDIPLSMWLDLSTGINPVYYPVPEVGQSAWQRLPEVDDGLVEAACQYYGCQSLLPTAGSQAAIQLLPQLRAPSTVLMPSMMYQEHAYAWQRHEHEVLFFDGVPSKAQLASADVIIVCNPNNPTGQQYSVAELLQWHATLSARKGWLVVDEAFMDVTPGASLAAYSHLPHLFVLRSLGKFFGLAGARVGFVLAHSEALSAMNEALGPWTLTGPSRVVAKAALIDHDWQLATRKHLFASAARLSALLVSVGLTPSAGTGLFQYVQTPNAVAIHQRLAKLGVWVRLFEAPLALRFGLPPEQGWERLALALQRCVND